MKRWDAIGFDLDGTLWDSTQTVVKSWSKVCREDPRVKKIPDAKDIQGIMGLTLEKIAKRFFPYLSLEEGLEILDRCAQDEVGLILEEGGRLFEGLEAVLQEVSARYPLFIVSNCHMGYIEAFLTHHRLGQYFCDTENHGHTGLSKGRNIRLVMERNHWDHIVYLGDTQGDYDAAQEAQVSFLHAAYGFGTVDVPVPAITDIRDLPRWLQQEE